MSELVQQPLSLRETWLSALKLYKASFSKVIFLSLLWMMWTFLPSFFLGIYFFHLNYWAIGLAYAWILGDLIFYTAIYHRIYFTLLGKPSGNGEALQTGLKKLGFLSVGVLISTALLFFGIILFIVPGIYWLVVLMFYFPLIVFDDLGPVDALKGCVELVRGFWWRSAIVTIIPVIFLVLLVSGMEYLTLGLHFPGHEVVTPQVWFLHHFIKAIVGVFYVPFFASIVIIQLQNLKIHNRQVLVENLSYKPIGSG